jgi:hypothetical protein
MKMEMERWRDGETNLESDVIIADPDFQLLLPDDVFFGPIRVVLSLGLGAREREHQTCQKKTQKAKSKILCDFARFYDPLEFFYDQWTDPHYSG